MSISFKKINALIDAAVSEAPDLSEDERRRLRDLCEKIYMIESSLDSGSAQQKASDMRDEIIKKAQEK